LKVELRADDFLPVEMAEGVKCFFWGVEKKDG
jgi:hypothetical protein